jgi:predicted nucleic acid-binding Zn ribbon protein
MPLPVLVLATDAQRKARQFDGFANFLGRREAPNKLRFPELPVIILPPSTKIPASRRIAFFAGNHLPVVIVGGDHLPDRECVAQGKKWDDLVALMQLRDAHETGDEYAIANALDKLFGTAPHIAAVWKRVPRTQLAPSVLPKEFSDRIASARLVLWWNVKLKRFQPAIFCEDLKTAMFVRAALRDLRACPSCDMPFRPERPDQEYCSLRCRERFRQRRRRANLQAKFARKVKRHGRI